MSKTKWNNSSLSGDEPRRQKREAVLMAGAKLFNAQGFERTSLDDIAKALNVTKRTIYYYVESKEEILIACNQKGYDFIRDVMETCSRADIPPIAKIELMAKRYAALLETEYGACVVLTDPASLSPEPRDALIASRRDLDFLLRRLVQEGIDDGTIEPCDPQLVTAAIYGALNWTAYWNRDPSGIDAEKIGYEYARLFINGLRKKD